LSQYVDVQNSPSLQIDSAISFSFWAKRNTLDNGQDQVLNKGGDWQGGTCNYGLVFSEWTLVFIYNGGYYIVNSPGIPLDNEWHHYAVTALEGTTEIHFYVDGVEKTSMLGAGNPVINLYSQSTSDLYLSGVLYYSNNSMDELKIYKRILSEIEIKSLYSNLVAYLPFNGNTNDVSGNGHDGTVNGNATLVPDRFNTHDRAYTFPDQSSNISLANTISKNLETGFTLNCWVKYKNTYSVIIGKHVCGYVNGLVLGIDYDGQFQLWLGNSGWQTVKTSATLVENRWYMVTATYDSDSGIAKIYLNGQIENTAAISYTNFSPYPISIGEVFQNNCSPANMSGAVDEVKIYNRPLSDAEILDEYNNTYNDLVLFLPFNGNANDVSGNNNNGTVSGASLTQDRFGVENKAYQFNGSSDYINVTNSTTLTITDETTLSAWVKRTRYNTIDMILEKGGDWTAGTTNYGLSLHYFNNMYYFFFNGGWRGTTGVSDFEWHHYAAVIKNGDTNPKLYIDGVLKPIEFQEGPAQISLYPSTADLDIGAQLGTYTYYSANIIDDIRIYNRLLDSLEVTKLYNDSTTYLPPLEDGLVAYWPFDGNTDDSTSNNNDGINYNGVFSKDRYGNDNNSMFFNAVDSYVEGINPGNNLPVGNSPRTFSAWIRNNQYNQYGCNIFHYGTQQAAPTNFHFLITDVLGLGNGYGYGVVYGNTNLIDSTWHFVTGVYEGGTERTTKLYIDGKLDVLGAITTEPNTVLTNNWRMGRFMEGSSNFNGNIDELKVYDIPLSIQQIWDMYKATTTAPNLLSPGNDSTLINPTMTGLVLDWDSTVTATGYRFLLANDSLFNTVIHDTLVNSSSFNFYDWFSVNIDDLYWKVRTINDGGIGPWSQTNRFNIILTDIEDETQLPKEFALLQNYPNPFNPTTTITYHLPKTANVELKVFDVIGKEITTLVDEEKSAGRYNVQFTMNNLPAGRQGLSSGIYFYQLKAGEYLETKKMILMK
jgi:hypothetical protein